MMVVFIIYLPNGCLFFFVTIYLSNGCLVFVFAIMHPPNGCLPFCLLLVIIHPPDDVRSLKATSYDCDSCMISL